MNRREALRRTALLMSTALSASAVAGVLQGCQPEPATAWTPAFFTAEEAETTAALANRIVPRTDTPGAVDAGVDRFIDKMLDEYYLASDQRRFRQGLSDLNEEAKTRFSAGFAACTEEQQDALLRAAAEASRPVLMKAQAGEAVEPTFFQMAREVTLLGYFTSQAGATEVLAYDPVPGGYTGCAPLEEVGGKTWAM